ncbi:MAG: polymorphic toxin type 15 domain-containing protein [Paracoccus sp. (in: a-proteobacteria)]|uniref:polymorphic toxin type 15 domain-containing protein n=1 Tax=Paracoccus sp. TaxID=267 RepID=UPI0026E05412|nr:polymorphic toxin type 15 domain-containing protein [Paracoccus sp. (in: a-proteobacteria)]MDO5612455.1 polymorphic toxin type 15 domain-containing protein [Paracoccus sp. (in: a-proteobacteria)]
MVGAAGVVAGLGVDLINPFRKAKAAGEAADALGDIGDATRAGGTTRRRRRDEDREEEDGRDGARSTGRVLRVRCFDMPPGLDAVEYDRQLAERMSVINNMTADDMGYAHWVLNRMREEGLTTDALRDKTAQSRHRKDYRRHLQDKEGISRSKARSRMRGLHATHFLDMVAGGDPRYFSHDAQGNPVLGGGPENSHIGNQWTHGGRADSLGQEAERMRRSGRAGEKMQVELRRC